VEGGTAGFLCLGHIRPSRFSTCFSLWMNINPKCPFRPRFLFMGLKHVVVMKTRLNPFSTLFVL